MCGFLQFFNSLIIYNFLKMPKSKKIKIVHCNPNKKQKKQPNCFILFRRDIAPKVRIRAKAASKLWNMLPDDVKEQYKCSYNISSTDGQKPGQSVFRF